MHGHRCHLPLRPRLRLCRGIRGGKGRSPAGRVASCACACEVDGARAHGAMHTSCHAAAHGHRAVRVDGIGGTRCSICVVSVQPFVRCAPGRPIDPSGHARWPLATRGEVRSDSDSRVRRPRRHVNRAGSCPVLAAVPAPVLFRPDSGGRSIHTWTALYSTT